MCPSKKSITNVAYVAKMLQNISQTTVLQQYWLANMVLQPHKITLHAANRGEVIVVFIFFAVFYYLALTGAL